MPAPFKRRVPHFSWVREVGHSALGIVWSCRCAGLQVNKSLDSGDSTKSTTSHVSKTARRGAPPFRIVPARTGLTWLYSADVGHPSEGTEYRGDRKSTRLNSSHLVISYAVFCLKKKKTDNMHTPDERS